MPFLNGFRKKTTCTNLKGSYKNAIWAKIWRIICANFPITKRTNKSRCDPRPPIIARPRRANFVRVVSTCRKIIVPLLWNLHLSGLNELSEPSMRKCEILFGIIPFWGTHKNTLDGAKICRMWMCVSMVDINVKVF